MHSAAGVMLDFLSRGCGERVSPSRGPVLNNKWPANRQTGPRTPTPAESRLLRGMNAEAKAVGGGGAAAAGLETTA